MGKDGGCHFFGSIFAYLSSTFQLYWNEIVKDVRAVCVRARSHSVIFRAATYFEFSFKIFGTSFNVVSIAPS